MTLEGKFGQPQAVLSTYLDKLSIFLPLIMHKRKCDQFFRDNLCLGEIFSAIALLSRSLHCINLRPSDTQAATQLERNLVHAYCGEELRSSDND